MTTILSHDSLPFSGHLCITFELLGINLYEQIKAGNFQVGIRWHAGSTGWSSARNALAGRIGGGRQRSNGLSGRIQAGNK